ncbi:MAG TPA: SDR family NAD(P)-dependent oxidoreductase [Rugosimonospora sp.]|nr:SDR family NAD(P)-dependent oxidoreductase [Rugosimonospora sp.]
MNARTTPDLGRLERAALTVPGVSRAAAVPSYGLRRTKPGPAPAPPAAPVPAAAGPSAKPLAEVDGGPVPYPDGAPATLQEALRRAASRYADRGTVYIGPDGGEDRQTYASLLDEAQRVLGGLRAAGLRPGDAALFQFDSNRNYVTTFWACVLGGFLPTPVGLAPSYQRHNAVTRKLHNAWRLLDRPVLLTDAATLPAVSGVGALWEEPGVRVLATEELALSDVDTDWYPATPDDPVLHLLTSGSTGVPKCVRHTHASVAARTYAAAHACGYGPDDVTMNWMPLDHVAIVMYNVRDVFLGCEHVNAKITTFLADPLLWLDWIDRHRATNTWAPNFAYAMVNERAGQIGGRHWDLSCMRAMTNAAEPVIARTAHQFLNLLAPHGLPADAMRPCWGMSETCSGTTYARMDRHHPQAATVPVDQSSLGGDLRPGTGPDAVTFTEVGPPIPGLRMRIVDESGAVLPEDRIGSLQVCGDVMMRGYHGNAEANAQSYTKDGWFVTGDLAFVHGGSLVITGRQKDQIIVRGVNYVAHELEAAVELVEGVEVTYVAAGGVPDPDQGSDRLALFFVPTSPEPDAVRQTVAAIRGRLVRDVGLSPDFVVPVSREEFPKTGSGKIQRGQLIAELRAGTFDDRLRDLATTPGAETGPPSWFFERVWRESPGAAGGTGPGRRWLLFAGPEPIELPGETIVVRAGTGFTATGAGYTVDPRDASHYARLLAEVGPVDAVVHAWGTEPMPATTRADLDAALARTAYSLSCLLTALPGDATLLVLTTGGVWTGDGDPLDPAKGGLPSLVRTAAEESTVARIRYVDAPGGWPAIIAAELATGTGDDVVAYRHGRRLAPRLRAVAPDDAGDGPAPLVAGGRYLVTGGLGGIGLELSQYLLAAYGARLLVLGRSDPGERLAELTGLGDVRYAAVDVADEPAVRGAVAAAEMAWGQPLSGVLHLAGAGIADQWADLPAHTLAREHVDRFAHMYRAKVHGTWVLARLLADRPRTPLILFSSVNGEFGGSGFGAYASANGYLQAFAEHRARIAGRPAYALAWSMWREVGMNRTTSPALVEARGFRPVGVDEGIASLLTALALDRPYLVIGLDRTNPHVLRHVDPEQLDLVDVVLAYAAGGEVSEKELRCAVESALPAGGGPIRLVRLETLPEDATGAVDRDRLRLTLARTRKAGPAPRREEPATPLESRLAAVWAQVLGRRDVGRHETFFELGGGSLQAAQVVARLNADLPARLAVEHLYEHPTVAQLATAVQSEREEPQDVHH